MTKARIGACVAASILVALGIVRQGWSEDLNPGLAIDCGGKCADFGPPGSFLTEIPRGTFVITVAHVAPSPEDAGSRTRPRTCKPIRARVDTLRAKASDGAITVALGERKQLAAGQTARIVHTAPPGSTITSASELDQVGFRLRADSPSSFCKVVASGQFFPEPTSTSPIKFDLMRGAGK